MKEYYPPGRIAHGATTLDGTEDMHAVDPRYSQAQDLISKGDKSGAIAELLGLLDERPGSAVAHNDLGCLYQELGEPEAALRHYEKAIEIDPAYTTALKNLAAFLFAVHHRIGDALLIYHRILSAQPDDVEALEALGHISIAMGTLDIARRFYRRILKLEPDHAGATAILKMLHDPEDYKGSLPACTGEKPPEESQATAPIESETRSDREVICCPFCGHVEAERYRTSADIVRCLSCSTVYLRTRLNKDAMRRVYQSYADGPSHMALPANDEAINKSGLRRNYFLNELLEFTTPVGKLLDVGCGWGAFLDNARDRGFEVQGIEVTRKCVAFANERLGIPVTDEPFEDVPFESGSLSVVTMLHVLEHLPEPSRAIENAYRSLKPGGIFCGIVPNIESLCSQELGERWYWLDPQYHYVHYSPSTLKRHLESAGFTVERLYTATGDYGRENVLQVIQHKQGVAEAGRLEAFIEQIERDGLGEEIRFFARKPFYAHRPAESPGIDRNADRGETTTASVPKGCASIIIPVFNQVDFTSRCLEALYANTPLDRVHEVIVVDNASSDGTVAFLEEARKRYPKLKVLNNRENLLFARACNQGADIAGGDVLVFLKNDTEPRPGWFDRAMERLERDDSIGAVGVKLLYPDGTVQHCGIQFFRNVHPSYTVWPLHRHLHASADDPRVNVPSDVDAVTGACLFIRTRLFRRIGGFEEGYGMYFEDTDLCFKVRRAGKRVFYEPASVVIHHEGKSSPTRDVVHALNETSARRFFKTWKEDLIRFELDTLVEKEEGRYAYLPENFWPEEVGPGAIVRIHALLSNFPPCYVHFGGAGDALLLLSTFYDKDPEQTVVSVSNSTAMMRSFFDAFPKLKKVYFVPFPKNYTWHFIARQFFKASDICHGLGATPTTTADYREWNADLDIFKTYGVQRRPDWAVHFEKNRIEPLQLVIQPRGSLKGMAGSKRNVIPPRDWPRLLAYLAKQGIRPVVIGTPDEAEEYPCLDKALDRRSHSFTEQLQLIAGSDFFVGADSWGKTFAALAGIPTFVFHAVRGDDLKGWKDPSDHVFLDPWEEITVVKDLDDFRRAFDAALHARASSTDDLKIRWEGSQFVHHSLALVNRELCSRLIAGGCELSVIPYERDQFSPKDKPRFKPIAARVRKPLSGPADVHVRHQWPPSFDPPSEGHWVMIQPWEFGSLPREWVRPMSELVDELWVPSRYVRDCFVRSGIPADRVHVVPNGVNTDLLKPGNAPYRLRTKKAFKFLFVGGTIQRKGIDILLDVYTRSFSSADDVCLVIKDMGGQSFYKGQTAKERIRRFQDDPNRPEIEYIERTLSDREIAGLYAACDCLVHPYRGEGFGLPIAEAMASGLPVIVTGHGAALDFCNETTAYLIPAKEVRLPERRVGEFETVDFPWLAEPDREALAGLMRHAAAHPEEAAAKGRLAAEFIRSHFTWGHAAEAVKKRVRELRAKPIVRLAPRDESADRVREPREAAARHEHPSGGAGVSISPALARADELYRRGNLRGATEAYLHAIKATPWDRECYLSMAEMLIQTKHYREAQDLLGEEILGAPDARMLSLLGAVQEGLGNDNEAERLAAQALALNPRFAPALNLRGVLAFGRGATEEAKTLFERAAQADPSWGEPVTNLGVLQWAAGEREAAFELLEKGFILTPVVSDLAERYHAAAVSIGALARAEKVFREARRLHPACRTIAFLLIDLLISQEKHAEAMQEIETALAAFEVDGGFIDAALEVRRQLGPMAIGDKTPRPTLSLCMIVRNEQPNLVRCLSSVKAAVDEIVIVDTGSTDRTKDLAAVFGARVFDFAWTDDFSSARNVSLSQAKGDWILVLDADETLSPRDHRKLREIIRKSTKRIGGYDLATRNYVMEANTAGWTANDGSYPAEEAGTGWYANRKVRLFRNDPRIRFSGAVHELVEASMLEAGMKIATCEIPVHHTGKLDRARVTEKGERYFELGMKKIAETGGTPRAVLELAVQAGELGRWDDAVDLWRRFRGGNPGREAVRACVNLINACLNADRFDEALSEARRAETLANGTRELLLNCAAAEFFAGDLRKAAAMAQRLLQKNPDYPPALGLLAMALALTGQEERGLNALHRLEQKGFKTRAQVMPAIDKLRTAGRGEQADRLLDLVDRHFPGADASRASAPDRPSDHDRRGLPR
ncbi:MAG: glycosyltransferase [Syntrophobacterales bacterium]|nr:glycosyltransferase [Syntrophobacterales bacterium]